MKRTIALLFAILAFSVISQAQTTPTMQADGTPHKTVLSCTPGAQVSGVTVVGFNFYKSTTSGGEKNTPAINGATPVPTCGFTDTNVTPGQTVFYVAEAQSSNGNQSAPSNEVSATTPNNPNPPTITILSVSTTIVGTQQVVLAKWTDSGTNLGQFFAFTDGTKFLAGNFTSSPNGTFAEKWTGPAGVPVTFMVINTAGSSASQNAN